MKNHLKPADVLLVANFYKLSIQLVKHMYWAGKSYIWTEGIRHSKCFGKVVTIDNNQQLPYPSLLTTTAPTFSFPR